MNIYFSPLSVEDPKGQELTDKLVGHLETREVTIANRAEVELGLLQEVGGLIVELSYYQEDEMKLVEAATRLGKPVLALAGRYSKNRQILENLDETKIRRVAYSQLYIATVAIDVFLEARCGYRVPLGPGDRMNLPEERDTY